MEKEIVEIVNRETEAWNTQNVEMFLSVFHPDMVWPWPPTNADHDPEKWEIGLGKFDHSRWKGIYDVFFAEYKLVHNQRQIVKVAISKEGDGAFAVVDIDTLWKHRRTGQKNHWLGRVCKVYAKTAAGWKLTMHTGVLAY